MQKLFRYSLFLFLITSPAFADVASLESNYVAGQTDLVGQLNRDRTTLANSVNNIRGVYAGSAQSSGQIKADTIGEENMADDANPRVRTAEGASCGDLVYSGLLPSTSSSLVLTIPAGVAYPDGYRVEKTSSTSATLEANKWTYYYLLTSGSFTSQTQTIDGSEPSQPANSVKLFRASTDATQIVSIQDLRSTSCATGPFQSINDAASEATLEDILTNGQPVRRFSPTGRTPQGFAQGAYVSWNAHTSFKVTPGALYINGKYRILSQDVTVTTSTDAPLTGGSGLDTGSVTGGPKRYYVYGVADQESVKTFSVTFSESSSAPTGVTNYRLIGSINSDASNLFTSQDTMTAHALTEREIIGGWVNFDGTGTIAIRQSYNVSSLTDNGTGDYTVTWDADFNTANYACVANGGSASAGSPNIPTCYAQATGSSSITTEDEGGTARDSAVVTAVAFGDFRR